MAFSIPRHVRCLKQLRRGHLGSQMSIWGGPAQAELLCGSAVTGLRPYRSRGCPLPMSKCLVHPCGEAVNVRPAHSGESQ